MKIKKVAKKKKKYLNSRKIILLTAALLLIFVLTFAFSWAQEGAGSSDQALVLVIVEDVVYEKYPEEIDRYLSDSEIAAGAYYGEAEVELMQFERARYAISTPITEFNTNVNPETTPTSVKSTDFLSPTEEKKMSIDLAQVFQQKFRSAGLVGIVLIGNIPIPKVYNGDLEIDSLAPYTDFDDPAYVYNAELSRYERTDQANPRPEIWSGYIPREWPLENHEMEIFGITPKFKQYFDDNHEFRSTALEVNQHILISDFYAEDRILKDNSLSVEEKERRWEQYLGSIEDRVNWTGRYNGLNRASDAEKAGDFGLKSADVSQEVIKYFDKYLEPYNSGLVAPAWFPHKVWELLVDPAYHCQVSTSGMHGGDRADEIVNEIFVEAGILSSGNFLNTRLNYKGETEPCQRTNILGKGSYDYCADVSNANASDYFNAVNGPEGWLEAIRNIAAIGPGGALVHATEGPGTILVNGVAPRRGDNSAIEAEYFTVRPGDRLTGAYDDTNAEFVWFEGEDWVLDTVFIPNKQTVVMFGQDTGFLVPGKPGSYAVPASREELEFYIIWSKVLTGEEGRRMFLAKDKIPPFGKYEALAGSLEISYTVSAGTDYYFDFGKNEYGEPLLLIPNCLYKRRFHKQSVYDVMLGAPIGKMPNSAMVPNLGMFGIAPGFSHIATQAVTAQMAANPQIVLVTAEDSGTNQDPYDPYNNAAKANAKMAIAGITDDYARDVQTAFESGNQLLIDKTISSLGAVGYGNISTDDASFTLIGFEYNPFILSFTSGMPIGEALKSNFDETEILYGDPLLFLAEID